MWGCIPWLLCIYLIMCYVHITFYVGFYHQWETVGVHTAGRTVEINLFFYNGPVDKAWNNSLSLKRVHLWRILEHCESWVRARSGHSALASHHCQAEAALLDLSFNVYLTHECWFVESAHFWRANRNSTVYCSMDTQLCTIIQRMFMAFAFMSVPWVEALVLTRTSRTPSVSSDCTHLTENVFL